MQCNSNIMVIFIWEKEERDKTPNKTFCLLVCETQKAQSHVSELEVRTQAWGCLPSRRSSTLSEGHLLLQQHWMSYSTRCWIFSFPIPVQSRSSLETHWVAVIEEGMCTCGKHMSFAQLLRSLYPVRCGWKGSRNRLRPASSQGVKWAASQENVPHGFHRIERIGWHVDVQVQFLMPIPSEPKECFTHFPTS